MASLDSVLSHVSPQQLTAAACWHVVSSRQITQYPNVLEFLETMNEAAPDLVAYRHYAKLTLGFKALIILDKFRQNHTRRSLRTLFNSYFPDPSPVTHPYATLRDCSKVSQAEADFRNTVQRLLTDQRFQTQYVETELDEEYGDIFMVALEKLLREYFVRLESTLPRPRIEELQESMKPVGRLLRSRENDPPSQLAILLRYFADMGWPPCDRGPPRAKVHPPTPPRRSRRSDPGLLECSRGAASRRSGRSHRTLRPRSGGEGEMSRRHSRWESDERPRKMDVSCSDSDQEVLGPACKRSPSNRGGASGTTSPPHPNPYKRSPSSRGGASGTTNAPQRNPVQLLLTSYQVCSNPAELSPVQQREEGNQATVPRYPRRQSPVSKTPPWTPGDSTTKAPSRTPGGFPTRTPSRTPGGVPAKTASLPLGGVPAKTASLPLGGVPVKTASLPLGGVPVKTASRPLGGVSAKTPSRTPGGLQRKTLAIQLHNILVSLTPEGSEAKTFSVIPEGSPQKTVSRALRGSPQKTFSLVPEGSANKTVSLIPEGSAPKAVYRALRGSPQKTISLALRGSPQKTVSLIPDGSPQKTVSQTLGGFSLNTVPPTLGGSPEKAVSLTLGGPPEKAFSRNLRASPQKAVSWTLRDSPQKAVSWTLRDSRQKVVSWTLRDSRQKAVSWTLRDSRQKAVSWTLGDSRPKTISRTLGDYRQKAGTRTLGGSPQEAGSRTLRGSRQMAFFRTKRKSPQQADSRTLRSSSQQAFFRTKRKSPQQAVSRTLRSSSQQAVSRTLRSSSQQAVSLTLRSSSQQAVSRTLRSSSQQAVSQTLRSSPQQAVSRTLCSSPQQAVSRPLGGSPQKAVSRPLGGSPQKAVSRPLGGSPQKAVSRPLGGSPQKAVSRPLGGSPPEAVCRPLGGSPQKAGSLTPGDPEVKTVSLTVGSSRPDAEEGGLRDRTQKADSRQNPSALGQLSGHGVSPRRVAPVLASRVDQTSRSPAQVRVALPSPLLKRRRLFRPEEVFSLISDTLEDEELSLHEAMEPGEGSRENPQGSNEQCEGKLSVGLWAIDSGVSRHRGARNIQVIPVGSRKRARSPESELLISPVLQMSPGIRKERPPEAKASGPEAGRDIAVRRSPEMEASAEQNKNTLDLPSILHGAEVTPQKHSSCSPSPASSFRSSTRLFQTPPEPSADVIVDSEDESSGSSKVCLQNYQRTKFNTFIPTFREHFRAIPRVRCTVQHQVKPDLSSAS